MADYRYAEVPVVEKRLPLRDVREGMFLVVPVATLDRDRSIRVAMRGSRRVEVASNSGAGRAVILDNCDERYGARGELVDVLIPETDESEDE